MRHLFLVLFVVVSALAFAQKAAPRMPEPSPTTATLTGQVVRTDTSEPVAKANVYLSRDNDDPQASATSRKTETDSRGEFRLDRILPGRYSVTATLSGFVGAHGGDATTTTLAFEAGDEARTLLRLAPTPVLVGQVLDEDGIPLREAQVKVIAHTKKGLAVLRTALTDERGEYRLYGFRPGNHLVCAAYRDRRKSSMRYAPRCFPDTTNVDEAGTIRFVPGQETPLNFVLFPEDTVIVHGVVSGLPVVQGHLATSVRVTFEPKWQAVVDDKRELTVQQASGRFEMKNVLPGTYTISASATTPAEKLVFRETVEIKDTDDGDLEITLSPEHSKPVVVLGELEFERLKSFTLKEVQVEFRPIRSAGHDSGPLPVPSRGEKWDMMGMTRDANGKFLAITAGFLATLDEGYTYVPVLVAQPPGAYLKSVFTDGRKEIPSTGFVARGNPSMQFVLATDSGSIEGDVVDRDGKPVGDAVVLAAPDLGDPLRTSTDQHGHFVFSGVAPRDYRVYAFDSLGEDDSIDADFLNTFSSRSETVKAATRSTVSTTLKLIHVAED